MNESVPLFDGPVQWFHNDDGVVAAVGSRGETAYLHVRFPTAADETRRIPFRLVEIRAPLQRLPAHLRGEITLTAGGTACCVALPPRWRELLASPLALVLELET